MPNHRMTSSPNLPPWLTSNAIVYALVGTAIVAFLAAGGLLIHALATPAPAPAPALRPTATPTLQLPPPWHGKQRINILLLGVDDRPWDPKWGAPRADAILLLTLDPKTMSGGVLSLPRDLWVNLPGIGYRKLNQAYSLGAGIYGRDQAPRYTAQVVSGLLGVPVHHYVVVNFRAFIVFVDAIHGVKIDVPKRMALDVFKADGQRYEYPLYPGRQVLSGALALAYARDRSGAASDFGRMQRQQQVLEGVFERLKDPRVLGKLLLQAPTLAKELHGSLLTDIPVSDALRLARLASEVSRAKVHFVVIGPGQTRPAVHWENGVPVEALDFDSQALLAARDKAFSASLVPTPTPYPWPTPTQHPHPTAAPSKTSTPAATPSPTPPAQQLAAALGEKPALLIENGTDTPQLACRTATLLQQWGFKYINTANAAGDYSTTTLLEYTNRPATLAFLRGLFGVPASRVRYLSAAKPPADIVVVLGSDWAASGRVDSITCAEP